MELNRGQQIQAGFDFSDKIFDYFTSRNITPMSEESTHYYNQQKEDWHVSRERLLKAGIRNQDANQVIGVINEMSNVYGRIQTRDWMMRIWEGMVQAELGIDEED